MLDEIDESWEFKWSGRNLTRFGPLYVSGEPFFTARHSGTAFAIGRSSYDAWRNAPIDDPDLLAEIGRAFLKYDLTESRIHSSIAYLEIAFRLYSDRISSADPRKICDADGQYGQHTVPTRHFIERDGYGHDWLKLRFDLQEALSHEDGTPPEKQVGDYYNLARLIFDANVDLLPFTVICWKERSGVLE